MAVTRATTTGSRWRSAGTLMRRWCLPVLVALLCACGVPGSRSAQPSPSPSPQLSLSIAIVTHAPRTQAPVPTAPANGPQRIGQLELSNQARAAAGLQPLAWNACLANVAGSHATEMAVAGRIYHGDGVDRDLKCQLGSRQTGENVGETSAGMDDGRIFVAFMNSSGHRANILGPYRFIGAAWVVAHGTGYVAVEFG